jgi:hypothetical protein
MREASKRFTARQADNAALRNHPVTLRIPSSLEKEGSISPPLTRRGGARGAGAVWGTAAIISFS